MIFEKDKKIESISEKIGYLFSYFLFTTILYLILWFLKEDNLAYFTVMAITLMVALIGLLFRRMLK